MAIYYLHAAKGARWRSAGAKYAYVTRAGQYAKQPDRLVHAESGRMPPWAVANPGRYWGMADKRERKNGRLYREYQFALPRELSIEQQTLVAREFAQHVTAAHSLPYTLALHAGHENNPHCHLVINERTNDGVERPPEQWFPAL